MEQSITIAVTALFSIFMHVLCLQVALVHLLVYYFTFSSKVFKQSSEDGSVFNLLIEHYNYAKRFVKHTCDYFVLMLTLPKVC